MSHIPVSDVVRDAENYQSEQQAAGAGAQNTHLNKAVASGVDRHKLDDVQGARDDDQSRRRHRGGGGGEGETGQSGESASSAGDSCCLSCTTYTLPAGPCAALSHDEATLVIRGGGSTQPNAARVRTQRGSRCAQEVSGPRWCARFMPWILSAWRRRIHDG